MLQHARLQQHREQHPVAGAPQVRAVIDVVAPAPLHPDAVAHVHHRVHDRRHRQEEHEDQRPRLDQDVSEQHRRHRAGCAKAAVARIIAVAQIAGQDRHQQRRQIEPDKTPRPRQPELGQIVLHRAAEEVQRDHVEQQMLCIGMDEAIAQKAPVLLAARNRRWPQDQPLEPAGFVPGQPGNHTGDRDQAQGDGRKRHGAASAGMGRAL